MIGFGETHLGNSNAINISETDFSGDKVSRTDILSLNSAQKLQVNHNKDILLFQRVITRDKHSDAATDMLFKILLQRGNALSGIGKTFTDMLSQIRKAFADMLIEAGNADKQAHMKGRIARDFIARGELNKLFLEVNGAGIVAPIKQAASGEGLAGGVGRIAIQAS